MNLEQSRQRFQQRGLSFRYGNIASNLNYIRREAESRGASVDLLIDQTQIYIQWTLEDEVLDDSAADELNKLSATLNQMKQDWSLDAGNPGILKAAREWIDQMVERSGLLSI